MPSTSTVAASMPAGQVRGADDRLHGVGQDRRLLPPARELLALAEQEVLAHPEALGHLGQRDGVHDGLADLGEGALVEVAGTRGTRGR